MPRRSSPSSDRLKQLRQKNATYIITCYQNEFFCDNHPDQKCTRGFFSLFLQVLYGISFAQRYGMPFFVDFGNLRYPYSSDNSNKESANFWETLVNQFPRQKRDIAVTNQRYEVYPLRIWERNHFRHLHQILRSGVKFKKELKAEMEDLRVKMTPFHTLGIHIRKTDHHLEVPPASDRVFLQKIKRKISGYDQLFVATDDAELLNTLKKKFPGKVMAHDCTRSSDALPVHQKNYQDGTRLAKEAMLDCIALSYCQELILSPSNFSYAALVFNPEIKYSIVESKTAKRKRLKTLLVYHLDRLGIRKW